VRSIGERLLQAAVAVEVDGRIQDLATPLRDGGSFRVLTDRDATSLPVLRHSAAHMLATAVRRLRPEAKIGFGPSIEDGFYYDFEVAEPFTPEDLTAFENEMRKVSAEKYPFIREEVNRREAQKRFVDDPLKLERLSELGDDEVISTYTDGPFVDLCRGPHVPDTSRVKHFKLTHTAGAYWRGDSKRQMLQRIYGTAFFRKEELDAHLARIEEAKKRDHRVLGKQLDLFMMHPFAPGAVFWTERGTVLFNAITDFIRERQRDDFHEIKTPLMYNKGLWEISGHWGKYRENMFLILDSETKEHDFSLKPMNCPSHYLLYLTKKHSYRELPLRYVTFDVLHRNEVTGALSGLTRVRQFQQDDCHVFITEDQIKDEVRFLVQFILAYYETFGLSATVRFATRPEVRIGDDNKEHRPVVIHRAIYGSFERFIAILTEHYAGAFPAWLAPVQVVGIPVADGHIEYLQSVAEELTSHGIRVEVDTSDDRMAKKIVNHTNQKVPFMLLAGDRDVEAGAVSFRFGDRSQVNGVPRSEAVEAIAKWIRDRENAAPTADLVKVDTSK